MAKNITITDVPRTGASDEDKFGLNIKNVIEK